MALPWQCTIPSSFSYSWYPCFLIPMMTCSPLNPPQICVLPSSSMSLLFPMDRQNRKEEERKRQAYAHSRWLSDKPLIQFAEDPSSSSSSSSSSSPFPPFPPGQLDRYSVSSSHQWELEWNYDFFFSENSTCSCIDLYRSLKCFDSFLSTPQIYRFSFSGLHIKKY